MSTVPRDESELMRAGVRARVKRLARTAGDKVWRWSPPVLVSMLSAGTFAPLLLNPITGTAVATVTASALAAVGGNMLTDVIKAGIACLGGTDRQPAVEALEAELEQRIQEILQADGEHARQLREEIAQVLRRVDVVGAALEAAIETGNRDLQAQLVDSLNTLGEEYDEFRFVMADLHAQLRSIQESIDRQGADLQVSIGLQYQQATDIRILREQVAAIEWRSRPDRTPESDAEVPRWDGCPYRGLVPFSEADAEVFYGREVATAQLVTALSQRLADPGLLVVTGASGSGKSSLLRAGLMPAIGRGELSEPARHWKRHVMERPTRSPLSYLATLLATMAGLDAPAVQERLAAQPHQAHLLVRQAVEADARRRGLSEAAVAASRLVLVVDQFEEIFTLQEDGHQDQTAAERAAFLGVLHAAAAAPCGQYDAPAALVVIAVRGDFIDRCADYPQLAAALAKPFVLGPMSEAELRRAITGPANAAGLEIEPGLDDAILAELRTPDGGYEAGALPLLSQAMLMTWEHREGVRLTNHGYGLTGGVIKAVGSSAEKAYEDLDSAGQAAARQVFHQLTVVSRKGGLARRATTRSALYSTCGGGDRSVVDEVLEAFTRKRLVVVDEESVEIAHDVLLSAWERLRKWLESDLAGYALYSQLIQDAEEWKSKGKPTSYLYRGERLANLLQILSLWQADPDRYFALPGTPQEFLDASERAERLSKRLRRIGTTVVTTAVVTVVIMAGVALWAQRNADRQRDDAVSRRLAAQAEQITSDPALSALLAAAAWQISPTAEARVGMLAVIGNPERAILTGHATHVNTVAFSPDGRTLATSSYDATVRLWDVATRKQIGAPLTGHIGPVYTLAFSPDGHTLATIGDDKTVRLWDVATHKQVGVIPASQDTIVRAVAFSPDGRTLAIGISRGKNNADSAVMFWDVTTGKQIGIIPTGHATVHTVAFSPDGHTLVSGDVSEVRFWDVATHKQVNIIPVGHDTIVTKVAFSPDGRTFATGSDDDRVRLWDVATRKQIGTPLTGHTGPVNTLAFSPDGHTLATGSDDETVRLWDVATHKQVSIIRANRIGSVLSVAFSPDGRTLATGNYDKTARLWDVASRKQIGIIPTGHDSSVSAMAFSPDGRTLATGDDYDETVRLWDVATHKQIGIIRTGNDTQVNAVAFSPDGRILATGTSRGEDHANGAVMMWDVTTHKRIGMIPTGHDTIVLTVAFSPDGRILASGGDETVRLWDVTTHKQVGIIRTGHDTAVRTVAFSPDGRTLAIGTQNGFDGSAGGLMLWDVTAHKQIGAPLTGHTGPVNTLAFSPDGRTLATGSDDETVRLWDVATRKQIGAPLTGHTGSVITLAFSPDGRTVASGGDETVRLWDVATRKQIGAPLIGHAGSVNTLAFSPDGRTLAVGSLDNTVRFWDIGEPQDLHEVVCAIPARSLTKAEWEQHVPEVSFRSICP